MKIVSINERQESKRKEEMLEVIDHMRECIENGEISEFVAASISEGGETQIHACAMDLPGGVGLFEIGKFILMSSEIQ
jgi:hypothetical protein